VHEGLCGDPDATLAELFDTFVRLPEGCEAA
jgi:hypothetical protein